jgi:hypothetical protein
VDNSLPPVKVGRMSTQKVQIPALGFGTPRRLPKASELAGRVVVLDVAFAGVGDHGFERITLPFIKGLGDRLRAWVDHHDHEEHARFADDPRFLLTCKSVHGACPELVDPQLVERIGPIDTICCHTDFDGLASAAKWIRRGIEPYPGCDEDARAIDTRLGTPSPAAIMMDRALRARPRDRGLMGLIVRHLALGLSDVGLHSEIERAAREMDPIEAETQRTAQQYARLSGGVAAIDITGRASGIDKTLLLMLGQELEPVSLVIDRDTVSVAARFDSGFNFLRLFGLSGGMPTRVALPRQRLPQILQLLGAEPNAFPVTSG